jgi:hypothetical protein
MTAPTTNQKSSLDNCVHELLFKALAAAEANIATMKTKDKI